LKTPKTLHEGHLSTTPIQRKTGKTIFTNIEDATNSGGRT